jgi:glycosyltransferase involved in cell wall biosynthesis
MKILWIPHATWLRKGRQRAQYFIERLKEKHEIHILAWTEPKGPRARYFLNPIIHVRALNDWTKEDNGIYIHHFRRFCLSRFNTIRKSNEFFFQKKIKKIIKEHSIDMIICGPNYYLNGFPPFNLNIPIIFDYSDYITNQKIKETYLAEADAVICASHLLHNEAKKYNKNCFYIPNGIDLARFKKTNPKRVKKKYDLEGQKVVSLIGITCSKSLYFLDAFPMIKKKIPDLKFLIVGNSYLLPEMERKAKKYVDDIIFTGWIDYNEIQDYFAASDIGTYPVDKNIYFDSACPIKILEYTAARKPVVSTNLRELHNLNFPNVVFCNPNPADFSEKIIKALNTKFDFPDLKEYDWDVLTEKLEKIMNHLPKR